MVIGFIVGATGGYTWALAHFMGTRIIMAIFVIILDYSRRLPM
jgi:ACS family D-galactonate transporter-like MFS transporter